MLIKVFNSLLSLTDCKIQSVTASEGPTYRSTAQRSTVACICITHYSTTVAEEMDVSVRSYECGGLTVNWQRDVMQTRMPPTAAPTSTDARMSKHAN